jgi:hypothetical protein
MPIASTSRRHRTAVTPTPAPRRSFVDVATHAARHDRGARDGEWTTVSPQATMARDGKTAFVTLKVTGALRWWTSHRHAFSRRSGWCRIGRRWLPSARRDALAMCVLHLYVRDQRSGRVDALSATVRFRASFLPSARSLPPTHRALRMVAPYESLHAARSAAARVRYFRQLLSADDLVTEQRYHRERARLHNRLCMARVCGGLEVRTSSGRS